MEAATVLSSRTATFSRRMLPGAFRRTSCTSLRAFCRASFLLAYCPFEPAPVGTWMLSGPSTPPLPVPLPL